MVPRTVQKVRRYFASSVMDGNGLCGRCEHKINSRGQCEHCIARESHEKRRKHEQYLANHR